MGILPTGYVGERKLRAVRDLRRRRAALVAKRTALILSLRNLQLRTKGYALDSSLLNSASAHDLVFPIRGSGRKAHRRPPEDSHRWLEPQHPAHRESCATGRRKTASFTQLLSVPGIGKILAMTILLEVADISRFPSGEDFASYCRTVTAIKTSNSKKQADNNRKCGNR